MAGCSHAQTTPTDQGPYGPSIPNGVGNEQFGPPVPDAQSPYGPEPVQIKSVVLVLGPGMARDFAASGVLHALHENKIPIGAIVASEFGSLVGALYAVDGNLNHFDWALMHFKESLFVEQGGMFSKLLSQGETEKLDNELTRTFGSKDLSQTKLPIKVALQTKATKNATLVEKGRISQAVRAAIAVPGVYPPGSWDGTEAFAARETLPFPIAEARALNLGPVIVLNALEKKDSDKLGTELKDADLVLEPELTGIGYMDFQRRTDAAFRGKAAVIKKLAEIRHLVGLPELPPSTKEATP